MIHPTLYHRDTKGKLRVWHIESEGSRYRTIAGLEDGEKVTSEWTACEAKNVGKLNETSPEAQCQREVAAQYTKKLDRKYHTSRFLEGDKPTFPMLAQTFKGDLPDPCNNVMCQPKLDGVRCIAKKTGLFSRQGKPFKGLAHIEEALKDFFVAFPDVILDGELYNHELKDDFNTIISAVKRGDPELAKKVQYHVYDCIGAPGGLTFVSRSHWLIILDRYTSQPIVRVQTHTVVNRMCLDELYGSYVTQGYEGQMIRLHGPYEEGKRSNLLLKRKEFLDAEFEVVGIEEGKGNWAGAAKRATLRLADGRTFGAGIKGNKEFLQDLLVRWHSPSFKKWNATVRYFMLTPDGIPRFPVAVAFYEGERDV